MGDDDPTAEVTDLLQHLIRNECVNDGTASSGHEDRNADVLAQYLGTSGFDLATFEPLPGRRSLVARMEGTDPEARSLLLMGHTDVVPANAERWRHDPFGGELIDGEVWGRGAVDMLNLTAAMAVAFKRLADDGFRPRGTITYLAVADEEALGTHGAEHLLRHERDAVVADDVLTEAGGFPIQTPEGTKLPVIVGEKGTCWSELRVKGTPGHASQPLRTDNAVAKAAEIIGRLQRFRPPTVLHDTWRTFITSIGFAPELTEPLLRVEGFHDLCEALPPGTGRMFHACTHTTIAPTVIGGGTKLNVIPDRCDLQLDIRTLPGQDERDVLALLDEAIGDLRDHVDIEVLSHDPASLSPADGHLWDTLEAANQHFYPGSRTVPMITAGATDARFFRRHGAVAYGYGLFSTQLSYEDYGAMFHGDDERVDVESLRLSTLLFEAVARQVQDR